MRDPNKDIMTQVSVVLLYSWLLLQKQREADVASHTRYTWLNYIFNIDTTVWQRYAGVLISHRSRLCETVGISHGCCVRQLESRMAPRGVKFERLCEARCQGRHKQRSHDCLGSPLLHISLEKSISCSARLYTDLCAQYSVLVQLPDGQVTPVRLSFDLKLVVTAGERHVGVFWSNLVGSFEALQCPTNLGWYILTLFNGMTFSFYTGPLIF